MVAFIFFLWYNIIVSRYMHKKNLVYTNQYHIIICPYRRRKILVDGVDMRLKEILYQVAKDTDSCIKSLEVMPDHVHVFIDFDPRITLSKMVQLLKGRSSYLLRKEFPKLKSMPCLWSKSYFSCTIGHINERTVQKYIEDQKFRS